MCHYEYCNISESAVWQNHLGYDWVLICFWQLSRLDFALYYSHTHCMSCDIWTFLPLPPKVIWHSLNDLDKDSNKSCGHTNLDRLCANIVYDWCQSECININNNDNKNKRPGLQIIPFSNFETSLILMTLWIFNIMTAYIIQTSNFIQKWKKHPK